MKKYTTALLITSAIIFPLSQILASSPGTTVIAQPAALTPQAQQQPSVNNQTTTQPATSPSTSNNVDPTSFASAKKLNDANQFWKIVEAAEKRVTTDRSDSGNAKSLLETSKQKFSSALISGILSNEIKVPRLTPGSKNALKVVAQKIQENNDLIAKACAALEDMRSNFNAMEESKQMLKHSIQVLRARLQNVTPEDKVTADILPIPDISEIQGKLGILEANIKALQEQKSYVEKAKTEHEMALNKLMPKIEELRTQAAKTLSQPGVSNELMNLHDAEDQLRASHEAIAEFTVQSESLESIIGNKLTEVKRLETQKSDLEQAKVSHIDALTGNIPKEADKMKRDVADLQKKLLKKEEDVMALQIKINDLASKTRTLTIKRDQSLEKLLSLAVGVDIALLDAPSSTIQSTTKPTAPATTSQPQQPAVAPATTTSQPQQPAATPTTAQQPATTPQPQQPAVAPATTTPQPQQPAVAPATTTPQPQQATNASVPPSAPVQAEQPKQQATPRQDQQIQSVKAAPETPKNNTALPQNVNG